MLDINLFRVDKGGNPDAIRESQRKRNKSVEIVDQIINLDKEWVKLRFDVDQLNKTAKAFQTQITEKMKAKEDAADLISQRDAVNAERDIVSKEMEAKEKQRDDLLGNMGNMVHESVIDSNDERNNGLIRTVISDRCRELGMVNAENVLIKSGPETKMVPHHQVLYRLDGYDAERGAKVFGHRGYFLKNVGLRLNQALINYGLEFLNKRNYQLLQTPFMIRREMMARCAQLEDYDEQLYKVLGGNSSGQVSEAGAAASEEKYLIATSEQPIACYHSDEWFEEPSKQLPIKYCGYSSCFRKEAGSHGKDTWGIFRIHQFEKIEQFVITEPEKSWEMFEEMISTSEAFFQSLGFSYRVVSIVSGALNNAAAKKYDLEAWFPVYGEYKELVSCSNCTDYQARRLEIRCGLRKMGDREKKYVHCLNSTLTATERTMCCLLENYQTPEGLVIPEVLRPYMNGESFIPYVKEAGKF